MIDSSLIATSFVRQQDAAAENTMRRAGKGFSANQPPELTAKQAEQVAADFEALFVSQMLTHMFGDSLGKDLFGSSESADAYQAMMVEQYGKQITAKGGIGIADYVKKELLKLQEIKDETAGK